MASSQNTSWREFERAVRDGLRASLAELPNLRVGAVDSARQRAAGDHGMHDDGVDRGGDIIATAEVDGRPVRLLVQAKLSGYPREVRAAVGALKAAAAAARPPVVPLLAAPALSPGSRALLREAGVSYWDAGGSLYLKLPHALYYVDRPAPKAATRRARTVYRGRTAQVLHALLLAPDRWWGVRELAAHAAVSPYTVHQVFTFLEEQLWVEKRGAGPRTERQLREPGALLDAWAEAHSLSEYVARRYHAWAQSPAALRRAVTEPLDQIRAEYALTLASGAHLVAPFGTDAAHVTLLVSAAADVVKLTEGTGLSAVDEGHTVTILVTRDQAPLLFRRQVDGVWVASDVQLYLDLWAYPQRGKEQARHLRAERLPY